MVACLASAPHDRYRSSIRLRWTPCGNGNSMLRHRRPPVTIRVHFALSPIERLVDPKQPATVEPARVTPNRAQWLPADFAFMYVYDCRSGQRQVDSTRSQVLDIRGEKSWVRPLELTRELEEQLYLGMVGRGVFGTPSVDTLREPKPGVTMADDGIDVTVVGEGATHEHPEHRTANQCNALRQVESRGVRNVATS
jgi:hypothetical protein